MRLKEQRKTEVSDILYCRIEPQNLSDFIMNLIEDLKYATVLFEYNYSTTIKKYVFYIIFLATDCN